MFQHWGRHQLVEAGPPAPTRSLPFTRADDVASSRLCLVLRLLSFLLLSPQLQWMPFRVPEQPLGST